jgi:hypothetical protein
MWADDFAIGVISRRLKLAVLLVDLARDLQQWPFRRLGAPLHTAERFIVIKREARGHYQPLVWDENAVRNVELNTAATKIAREKAAGAKRVESQLILARAAHAARERCRATEHSVWTMKNLPPVLAALWFSDGEALERIQSEWRGESVRITCAESSPPSAASKDPPPPPKVSLGPGPTQI